MTTPIHVLKLNEVYGKIRARIYRLWINNDFVTNRLISLDYLLVDKEVTTFINTILHYILPNIAYDKLTNNLIFLICSMKQ